MKCRSNILVFFLLQFVGLCGYAGTETYLNTIKSQDIYGGTVIFATEDGKFAEMQNPPFLFLNNQVTDRVIAGVNQEYTGYWGTSYDLTLHLQITWQLANGTYQTAAKDLAVAYDPHASSNYNDRSVYKFTGGHSVVVELLQVTDNANNNANVSFANLPPNLFLNAEIEIDRIYIFSLSYVSDINYCTTCYTSNDNLNPANELELSWDFIPGAESYDLEWTFINDYGITSTQFLNSSALSSDFKNNSTRVNVNTTSYRIPILFEHGYLLFRVRGTGRDASFPDKEIHGRWSSHFWGATIDLFGNDFYYVNNKKHEQNKNWQMTSNFAEEGKRKESISYFDGSLRNRQAVSRLNSTNKAIVGETIYDHQGRAAIQILPVPSSDATIKFYDNFNRNPGGSNGYSRSDFDVDGGLCGTTIGSMNNQYGASKYYSINQDLTNQPGYQSYVPDAVNYPFTQIEYTPDNTGRIRRQSGVGPNHKLESDHETKYFYGSVRPRQMMRLFGSETGDVSHYKRNMVVDANGQVSTSYLDIQGRVIATSLAGEPPSDKLLDLPSASTAQVETTEDLFEKNSNGVSNVNRINTDGNAVNFVTDFPVTTPGTYQFHYDLMPGTFTDDCIGPVNVCFDCEYIMEMSITDECGNEMIPGGAVSQKIYDLSIDLSCATPLQFVLNNPGPVNVEFTEVGNYTIIKRLKVNEEKLDAYADEYVKDDNNNCIGSLQGTINSAVAAIDASGCDVNCENCIATLGTQAQFEAAGGTPAEFAAAVAECNEMCTNITPCKAAYDMMLSDVSPGGQYAKYKTVGSEKQAADLLSLYHPNHLLPTNQSGPLWRFPTTPYKEPDGVTSSTITVISVGSSYLPEVFNTGQVYTNTQTGEKYIYPENLLKLKAFIFFWKKSWAKSLVSYHPEYCYYLWCQGNDIIPQNQTMSSEEFDLFLMGADTYLEINAGINIYDPNATNFILNKDPYFTGGQGFFNQCGNVVVDQKPLMLDKMLVYSTANSTPFSIWEFTGSIMSCGSYYNSTSDLHNCLNNIYGYAYPNPNPNGNEIYITAITAKTDFAWKTFRDMYLSAKQALQQKEADRWARDVCGAGGCAVQTWWGYNGCIGANPGDFDPFSSGMINFNPVPPLGFFDSPYFQSGQPCSAGRDHLYSSKIKRFINRNDVAGNMDGDALSTLQSLQNQADFDLFSETGQCPLAHDLQLLLDALGKGGNLVQTIDLLNVPEFTNDLYTELAVGGSGFADFHWVPTISNSGATLSADIITTAPGYTDQCSTDVTLNFAVGSSFNWNQVSAATIIIRHIKKLEFLATTPDYQFRIIAVIDADGNLLTTTDVQEVTIYGQTCLHITGCVFPNLCKPTSSATNLEVLMSSLAANGDLTAVSPSPVSLSGSYAPLFAPLKPFLGTGNWYWEFQGGSTGQFKIYDINPGGNPKFFLVDFQDGFNFSSINTLTDIGPDINQIPPDPTNFFVITAHTGSNFNLTGVVTIEDGTNSVPFIIGGCSQPTPTLCDDAQHRAVDDLQNFLNSPAFLYALDNNSIPLGDVPEFIPIQPLTSAMFDNPRLSVTSFVNLADFTADFVSTQGTEDISDCGMELHFVDPAPAFGFNSIVSFSNIVVDESILIEGLPRSFIVTATDGTDFEVIKGSSCIPISNCLICPPAAEAAPSYPPQEAGPGAGCQNYYNYFLTRLAGLGIDGDDPASDFYISLEDYCENNMNAVDDNYISYLTGMGLTEGDGDSPYFISPLGFLNHAAEITPQCLPDYIDFYSFSASTGNLELQAVWFTSLTEFCEFHRSCYVPYQTYLMKLFGYFYFNDQNHFADFTAFKAWTGFATVDPQVIELVGPADFCNNNLYICSDAYSVYLVQNPQGASGTLFIDIGEFCDGGVPTVNCETSTISSEPVFPSSDYENLCEGYLIAIATQTATVQYNEAVDNARRDFKGRYRAHCLSAIENFTVHYFDKEHHFTLYYYDQAGNLVRTVPPKGVKFVDLDADNYPSGGDGIPDGENIKADLTNGTRTVFTQHTMTTTYRYNSLNQLVAQAVPDNEVFDASNADEILKNFSSRFYYDKLGRLVASQNSKQYNKEVEHLTYSYTLYDFLGRISEVGEIHATTGIEAQYVGGTLSDALFESWISSGTKTEITKTFYDAAAFTIPGFTQENLRTRVSSSTLDEDGNGNYEHATHYSYDIHGNVKTLVQDNPALAPMSQQYKKIDYDYDLVSGNVKQVTYQSGQPDQFLHKYEYDADNRISNAYTSRDGTIWDQDAKYFYYNHGPLARVEYGDNKVQAMDYAYTLQGWVKGINSNVLDPAKDIGKDGTTGIDVNVGRDAMSYSLGYYNNDYSAIIAANNDFIASTTAAAYLTTDAPGLFNGNISRMVTTITNPMNGTVLPQLTAYRYDQLNRIKQMKAYRDITNNAWGDGSTYDGSYQTNVDYDPNGNIKEMTRNGRLSLFDPISPLQMDDLRYIYENDEWGYSRNTNKLRHVGDNLTYSLNYQTDIDDQGPHIAGVTANYDYDEIGNLIKDAQEKIDNIEWTVYGKIKKITRTPLQSFESGQISMEFAYDANGNRIKKTVANKQASEVSTTRTFYVRDAQGNILSTYEQSSGFGFNTLKLKEHFIYGNNRTGIATRDQLLWFAQGGLVPVDNSIFRMLGEKQYEMGNHLGNVLASVDDRRVPHNNGGTIDYFTASITSANDYGIWGDPLPQRNFNSDVYKFGFNGKENDNEVKGTGNQQDYGMRIYDTRLGRFLSIDPLTWKYPELTPYQFSSNRPIDGVDLDGLEYATFNIIVSNKGEVMDISITKDYELKEKNNNNAEYGPKGRAGVKYNTIFLDKEGKVVKTESKIKRNLYKIYGGGNNPKLPVEGGYYKDVKDNYELEGADQYDEKYKKHDINYDDPNVNAKGPLGLLFNKKTVPADKELIQDLDKVEKKNEEGEKFGNIAKKWFKRAIRFKGGEKIELTPTKKQYPQIKN